MSKIKRWQPRRSFMTLLEVMIGIVLTMMILGFLTNLYYEISLYNKETDRAQKEGFQLRYLENRLATIFPEAFSEIDRKEDFVFFSSNGPSELVKEGSTSLLFIFNNSTVMDKKTANADLGRLYLDKQKRLCLAIWAAPERWEDNSPAVRKEILMEDVEELAFLFFVAPERDRSKILEKFKEKGKVKETPESKADDPWLPQWKKEYQQLPPLIKLTIKRKVNGEEKILNFAYLMPRSPKVIVYEK